MDLVSSIRKSGSRGGVNFKWEDVATSNHRENYLGHSLKAPVGRWAKGKDLTWYAKADEDAGSSTETAEEKAARERQEEIRRIKELEEEALARALGLPVAPKKATGANSIGVGQGENRGTMTIPRGAIGRDIEAGAEAGTDGVTDHQGDGMRVVLIDQGVTGMISEDEARIAMTRMMASAAEGITDGNVVVVTVSTDTIRRRVTGSAVVQDHVTGNAAEVRSTVDKGAHRRTAVDLRRLV
ncbi:hypothetical protein DL770_010215 [Monosporascus sp. CRB-9-2]|nr:hypothetical protein DL770_010215 [Monosporascus sp. CRB-9-2]